MMNSMIRTTNKNGYVAYFTCPAHNVQKFIELIDEFGATTETFAAGQMPFNALPEDAQAEVKKILRAFDSVNVVYENDKFNVSPNTCICASYPRDHFVCGYYKVDEIYTKEERRQNFFEEFGYVPFWLA